jgi:PAS domain S-box-containing protein
VLAAVAIRHDGLVATDLRGRIVSFSTAAETITGHSEAEARQLSAADFCQGGREEAASLMERMRRDGEVRNHSTWLIKRDGGRVAATISVLPLRNQAGTVIGTLGIVARPAEPQG